VEPRPSLKAAEKRKIYWKLNPDSSAVKPVGSRYSDSVIPALGYIAWQVYLLVMLKVLSNTRAHSAAFYPLEGSSYSFLS
jgi:hypothetical protein